MVCLVCTSGVSIFGISFQVPFAKDLGFGPLIAALSSRHHGGRERCRPRRSSAGSPTSGPQAALIFVHRAPGLAQFGVLWAGNVHNEALFLFFAFISGFGGGAFYPMFAALMPDYFGENHNATNYGLVYSGEAGQRAVRRWPRPIVVDAWGYTGAYTLAGIMGLVSAVMALGLRQPGRPKAKKIEPNPYPISREIM